MADKQDVFGDEALFSEFSKTRPSTDEILTGKHGDNAKSLLSRATDAWRKDGRGESVSATGLGKHTIFYSDDEQSGSDGEIENEIKPHEVHGEVAGMADETNVGAEAADTFRIISLEKKIRDLKRQNILFVNNDIIKILTKKAFWLQIINLLFFDTDN